MGRPGGGRARSDGNPQRVKENQTSPDRRADTPGAPDRANGSGGSEQLRGGRRHVPLAENSRNAPDSRLPQARDPFPDRLDTPASRRERQRLSRLPTVLRMSREG